MIRYRPNCSGSCSGVSRIPGPAGGARGSGGRRVARQRRAALGDQAGELRRPGAGSGGGNLRGWRGAELAADLVLGLDQVGGDVAGAAQLGKLLEVGLEADLAAVPPLPFEVDLDHLGQCRQSPGAAGRDLVESVGQETFIPALIKLDEPRVEHLAIIVGEVGESGIQCGHVKTPGRAEHHRTLGSGDSSQETAVILPGSTAPGRLPSSSQGTPGTRLQQA